MLVIYPGDGAGQAFEVQLVTGPIRQADIEIALLLHRIEVLLVNGKSEDIRVAGEAHGSAVALVQIAVDDRKSLGGSFVLETAPQTLLPPPAIYGEKQMTVFIILMGQLILI